MNIWGKIVKKKTLLTLLISVSAIILLVIIVCLTFLVINVCRYRSYLELRPSSQKNTTWSSEDNQILLHIDESGKGKLTFEENGSVIECYFVSEQGYCASVYDIEALENNRLGLYPEEYYERWAYSKTTKDSFTIVVEKSTFFEVGDKITFNKKDKG